MEDASKLTDRKMIDLTHEYMKEMGIVNTQYIIVRHHDREHPHTHIVFNRIITAKPLLIKTTVTAMSGFVNSSNKNTVCTLLPVRRE